MGSLRLPDTVSFVAAANPADVAAAGWELAAPTASRFVHLDWGLPLDVVSEGLVAGVWPALPVHTIPATYAAELADERVLLSGFLRARGSQLSAIPTSTQDRGRAFPAPRTWDYATRLRALARAVGTSDDAARLLVAGAVGDAAAHEYLAWTAAHDLPDPEALLANPDAADFTGMRSDLVYVTLQSVLSAVVRQPTVPRWSAAIRLCAAAARGAHLDPALPVVRALLRPTVRPPGAGLPPEIKVFGAALALAGLLPEDD